MKSVKYTGPMEVFKHFQIDQPFRHYMNPEKTNYIETNNEPNFMVDRQFAQDLSSDSKSKWHIEYQFGIQTILGAETPSAIRERLMTKKSTLKYIKEIIGKNKNFKVKFNPSKLWSGHSGTYSIFWKPKNDEELLNFHGKVMPEIMKIPLEGGKELPKRGETFFSYD